MSGRARTTRWFAIAIVVAFLATAFTGVVGLSGLAERVAAAVGVLGIALLAVAVLRGSSGAEKPNPGLALDQTVE